MKEKPWTLRQVADYYDVTVNTVRYWVRVGRIKAHKVGKHLRFWPEDVYGMMRQACNG